jgi:carboxyl-terminal processing protease
MRQKKAFLFVSFVALVALGVAANSPKVLQGGYKLMGLLSEVVSLVRASYVEEVPMAKLEEGALTGLVTTADPQGTWVPQAQVADFRAYLSHSLPPFGLVVGWQGSYPVVLQVLPQSAAAKAGLVPGELLEKVDEQPVRARPLWRLLTALEQAQKRGTGVKLEVIARDLSAKRSVKLEGAQEGDPSPSVEMKGQAAVVRVPLLAELQLKKLAELLPATGPLVVDLRGTVLGDPQSVVQAAALLAGGQFALQLQGAKGKALTFQASAPPQGRKVVVCVDHSTARAGEWLAYLLAQRGLPLVGVETFGDTALRQLIPAADGELWVAKQVVFDKESKPILGKGLKPTHQVRPQREGDPILEKALELALGQEKAQAA